LAISVISSNFRAIFEFFPKFYSDKYWVLEAPGLFISGVFFQNAGFTGNKVPETPVFDISHFRTTIDNNTEAMECVQKDSSIFHQYIHYPHLAAPLGWSNRASKPP